MPSLAAESYIVVWPHGAPEAIFTGKSVSQTKSAIASTCFDRRLTARTDEDGVSCEYEAPNYYGLLVPRGATVKGVMRFTIIEVESAARVIVSDKIVQANAFGQIKESRGENTEGAADILKAAGGSYPKGTTFVGLDLGLDVRETSYGVDVFGVDPNGPAAASGFKKNDWLRRMNGQRFDYLSTMRSRLAKLPAGAPVTFEVHRGKEKLILSVTPKEVPPK